MKTFIYFILLTFSFNVFANELNFSFDKVKFDRLGVTVGIVSPSDIESTTGFGFEIPLGEIAKDIHLGGNLDYWASRQGNLDFSDFIMSANARYMKDIVLFKIPMTIYGGAGIDFHFYSYEINTGQIVNTDGSNSKLGLCFFAGDIYNVKDDLDLMVEARYRTNVDQFQLKFGAIFHLF